VIYQSMCGQGILKATRNIPPRIAGMAGFQTAMYAIQVQADQPERPLVWQETPDPAYSADDVLVDIYATALNRADLSQRAGNYPPPPGAPDILGLEMAGVIAAVGSHVRNWQAGDRVCALLGGGGYAERVAIHHSQLIPIPPGWSFEEAAALPEVYLTAFVNLFMEARLQPGEVVLVHGGASGVGTAAIQMLHHLGHQVITTAGSDKKVAACRALGADLAINYRSEDFAEAVRTFTERQGTPGVDVILDIVGASYFERNFELLKVRGRLVFIATLGGGQVNLDIGKLMRKRARLIGSVLRPRSLEEKQEIKDVFMNRCWPLIQRGVIRPLIDTILPITEANAAQARMANNENIGKIVLRVRERE
jgi:putative PIG3 family NAD(P)H quinone oxidoreductase